MAKPTILLAGFTSKLLFYQLKANVSLDFTPAVEVGIMGDEEEYYYTEDNVLLKKYVPKEQCSLLLFENDITSMIEFLNKKLIEVREINKSFGLINPELVAYSNK